jgi:hypothetical protein
VADETVSGEPVSGSEFPDEVADNIGHVRRRVARNMQRDRRDVANRKSVAIVEEPVKFRAVARELGPSVENLSEHVLDRDDLASNGELAAQFFLDVWRGRQVIGVRVRFEKPIDRLSPG